MNVVPPIVREEFDWADVLRLEHQLTEEERPIQIKARGYARDKLAPRVQEAFRREQTDPGVSQEKVEPGLMAN